MNNAFKEFKYFKKSKMILVKNEFSKGLENVYYGKKRFIIKDVPKSERYLSLAESELKGVVYLTILNYKADNKNAEVTMHFINGIDTYSLVKKKNGWKIKDLSITLDESPIDEPTVTTSPKK